MKLILDSLKLIRALHEFKEAGHSPRSEVKLMPKTLEQLDDALQEAQSLCIVSVFDNSDDMIVEHHLVPSKGSSEVLAEMCRKYIDNDIEDDELERIKEDGFSSTASYNISAIHLDSQGCYNQSPGEDDATE